MRRYLPQRRVKAFLGFVALDGASGFDETFVLTLVFVFGLFDRHVQTLRVC